mgnify:CR=1 FL=1
MNNKIIIALSLIIALLILTILINENKHTQTIAEYLNNEIQQEQSRLEVSQELVKGYKKLQEENERLNKLLKDSEVEWELYTVTGYSANDPEQGTNNVVSTGFNLDYTRVQNLPIAASNCIPLYSIVEIHGLGGFIILDTGLGYKTEDGWEDENWIDILFPTKEEALALGRQQLEVRIIE